MKFQVAFFRRVPIAGAALCPLLGCAIAAHPEPPRNASTPDDVVVSEAAPPHVVRYTYDMQCRDQPSLSERRVVVTGLDQRTADASFSSALSNIEVDGRALSTASLAQVNAQFPQGSFGYRPGILCSTGEIEFQVSYRRPLTAAGVPVDGTVVFKVKPGNSVLVWKAGQDDAPDGW